MNNNVNIMHSVSIFRWFYGVSPLLVRIQGCGFCDTVLLMVFKAQGVIENFAFWDTVCNSVKLYLSKKMKNKPNVLFHVEISGVIRFLILVVFEK